MVAVGDGVMAHVCPAGLATGCTDCGSMTVTMERWNGDRARH